MAAIAGLVSLYRRDAAVRRLFLDEVTSIPGWERGIKRLVDSGELRSVLVVTTGSRATDLRRGAERLPGRKGKLARTNYWFTPVAYGEFVRVCGDRLGDDALPAYMLAAAARSRWANSLRMVGCPSTYRRWCRTGCSANARSRVATATP